MPLLLGVQSHLSRLFHEMDVSFFFSQTKHFTNSHPLFTLLCLPLILLVSLYLIINNRKKKLPPGPWKLTIIGNLHQLSSNSPHKSLQSLAKKHGPLMHLQLGSVPTLVISSADVARDIFKAHDLAFSGRPVLYAANKLSYNCNDISFAPCGEYWREVRKIVINELLSQKRVMSFKPVRDEEVSLMLRTIRELRLPDSVNLSELTLKLANNVVCRVAFGKKFEGEADKFYGLLQETQLLLGGFCVADYFPWMVWLNKLNGLESKLEKSFRQLDKLYDQVIEEHLDPSREKSEHEDLVDVLLRIQKDPNRTIALSNEKIKGILADVFTAGTDTSSATLVWVMTELMRNPSVMEKARAEVREVIKNKKKVEESDLVKLKYLKDVVRESLRLHQPTPLLVPRETTESCEVLGYNIPAKTRVFINATSIAMDPKYWNNAEEFSPERFENSLIDFKGQHFELIPFGVGRRGCPGTNFAMLLIELALASLLHSFDWELCDGQRIEDLDMDEAFGITMHKKTPLRLVARPVIV